MKLKFLIFSIVALQYIGCTQNVQNQSLQGEWVIKDGWFDKDVISLERLNTKKHKTLATMLIFAGNDTLSQQMHNPEKLGFCGMGMLHFDTASWQLNKDVVSFDIKGGRIAVNVFKYKVNYNVIMISKDKITLKRQGKFIAEEKNYSEI